jgi:hypothetical protein
MKGGQPLAAAEYPAGVVEEAEEAVVEAVVEEAIAGVLALGEGLALGEDVAGDVVALGFRLLVSTK